MSVSRSILILCLCSTWCWPALAHNGAVAYSHPLIAEIVVDGDLSEWPEGMPEYPLKIVDIGESPQHADDFAATFRVGYNPGSVCSTSPWTSSMTISSSKSATSGSSPSRNYPSYWAAGHVLAPASR